MGIRRGSAQVKSCSQQWQLRAAGLVWSRTRDSQECRQLHAQLTWLSRRLCCSSDTAHTLKVTLCSYTLLQACADNLLS